VEPEVADRNVLEVLEQAVTTKATTIATVSRPSPRRFGNP